MKPITYDVTVIGAGIIGTSIAEKLAFAGKKVLLIDKLEPGEGCSKGNAGHFASDIILPLANFKTLLKVPKLLLDPLGPLSISGSYLPKLLPWLLKFAWAAMPHKTKQTIEALKLLNRPAIKRYQDLLERNHLTHLMTKQGALTVYQSESAVQQNKQHAEFVSAHGVNVKQLSGGEIRDMQPALSASIRGGLFYPDAAHCVDPHQLVLSLAEKFIERGGEIKKQAVNFIDVSDPSLVKLTTDSETILSKEVVIACGAWSKQLTQQVGFKVPLETERGYHLMLPEPSVELTCPVSSFERSFVMTPMAKGLRLAGTVELAGLNAAENFARAEILYQHAQEILPQVNKQNATSWMGHRPSLPDSLPVIGRSPKHNNVLFAFGHQHLGLTQAAVTADLICESVFNQPHEVDISPFRVDRF